MKKEKELDNLTRDVLAAEAPGSAATTAIILPNSATRDSLIRKRWINERLFASDAVLSFM